MAEESEERRKRWEAIYAGGDVESLPWFYPELDHDFAHALKDYRLDGRRVLDLCTGPGTQAMALAEQGYSVTAMDIADTAVKQACLRASEQGLDISFHRGDILDSRLSAQFDAVFDRGCYHTFPEEQRRQYVPAVAGLIVPQGYLFLKCFSTRQKGDWGPHRIAAAEIREFFASHFEVLSVEDSRFGGTGRNAGEGAFALFCVMRRR